jgi:hypothetical protein
MKRLVWLAALVAAMTVLSAGSASASNNSPTQCGGTQIANVVYKMVNDYDSNTHGGAWANDSITRKLKVFDTGDGTYCATVNDTGSFVTLDADSPSGTGTISAGIKGQMNGGYVASITGTLSDAPAYKTKGFLGTFDLQCTDAATCPGTRPSFLSYFNAGASYSLDDWGWIYHTARNGTWVNAASGNSGDITD